MRCHYCGSGKPIPKVCPSCGSPYIAGFGTGTEKVEQMVKAAFPEAKVLRMDMDTTSKKGSHEAILHAFSQHEADILVGTQMIVKGHDFPNVTLVGILLADTTLHMSDYMASERTFELLTQAAGRAGRGEKPGKVIIQTYDPEHYSIRCSAEHDYDAFYEEEIAYRDLMNYPPVMHMLNIRVASEDENCGEKAAVLIKQLTEKQAADGLYIIGPSKAAIYKISDVYYRTIYYKHKDYKILTDIKDLSEKYIKDNEDLFKKCQVQYDFR
jgi:primosomal protein N' (replication factor Y)